MVKKYRIVVNGEVYEVEIEEVGSHQSPHLSSPVIAPERIVPTPRPTVSPVAVAPAPAMPIQTKNAGPVVSGAGVVASPMPGTILQVKVKVGDTVKYGQPVVILEAMKMENEIVATADGTIREVRVNKGATVSSGDVLVVIG